MRDGVKLHTTIFRPKDAPGNLPFILTRTPYGIAGGSRALRTSYAELADEGYIFVLQDIRGRYTSEGQFVMLRPLRANRSDPKAVDEATDTYDTYRVVAQERSEQQRPRRTTRRLVSGMVDGDVDARSASRPQGRVAAGIAGIDVPRRRFPSQRRVPSRVWLRVFRDDGRRQGTHAVRVRPVRQLQLVALARFAREHQPEILARLAAHVERLRRTSELRRVLAARSAHAVFDESHGPDAQRRGMVGPGRLLRSRSRSTANSRSTTPTTRTISSSARGITAAGAVRRDRSSRTSTSGARRRRTIARTFRRRGSPTGSRTKGRCISPKRRRSRLEPTSGGSTTRGRPS